MANFKTVLFIKSVQTETGKVKFVGNKGVSLDGVLIPIENVVAVMGDMVIYTRTSEFGEVTKISEKNGLTQVTLDGGDVVVLGQSSGAVIENIKVDDDEEMEDEDGEEAMEDEEEEETPKRRGRKPAAKTTSRHGKKAAKDDFDDEDEDDEEYDDEDEDDEGDDEGFDGFDE